MNNEKYNQIIDEAYKNYLKHNDEVDNYWIKKNPEIESRWKPYSKEEFINKCITDIEFSEKWGLKIEESELSLEDRSIIAKSNHYEVSQNIKMFTGINEDHTLHKNLDENKIPSKLITLTYNNKTIESYE